MHKNNTKIPNNQNIIAEFNGGSITNFAGIIPFFNFMDKLGVFKEFNKIDLGLYHNYKYDNAQILTTTILGLLCGADRISKLESFSKDPLVRQLVGIDDKICDSTFINRMSRFTMGTTSELMDINGNLSKQIHKKLKTRRDILDMDSTIHTVYGNQEGAKAGFNPRNKGANSYHSLLGFLNSTRECILAWLRPGNSYTSNNAAEFLKQGLSYLPKSIKELLIRCDCGFFSEAIIAEIEKNKNCEYLIKVKLKDLKSVLEQQDWQSVPEMSGVKICDFEHKPASWEKSRRFVAVRIKKVIQTEEMLFPLQTYQYFCYCTNIEDNPLQLHRLYGDRGTSENWIENLKQQMFAGRLLTDDFWANEAFFQCSVLAYNASLWMRKLSDKSSWHQEPRTFREWFVQLAGRIVRSGRRTYLKMHHAYHYKQKWRIIDNAVKHMAF